MSSRTACVGSCLSAVCLLSVCRDANDICNMINVADVIKMQLDPTLFHMLVLDSCTAVLMTAKSYFLVHALTYLIGTALVQDKT